MNKIKISLSLNQVTVLSTYLKANAGIETASFTDINKELQNIIDTAIKQYADDLGITTIDDTPTRQIFLINQ